MMKSQTFNTLLFSVEDGIATISLNRPEKLNAVTGEMLTELIQAFEFTDKDDQVKVVIVTGSGRAFCAGADLSSGADALDFDDDNDPHVSKVNGIVRDSGGMVALRIFNSLKPVISACNGPAVGIGATIQLPMDIRLASADARFGFPFSRRGIVPESVSSWFLPRLVGISTALEWCYSGRIFSAEEALQGGLVRSLHDPGELIPEARKIAREIADNTAPVSIALTRQLLWRMMTAGHPMAAHRAESLAVQLRGRSDDVSEGIMAFLEKRSAAYPNTVSQDFPDVFPDWNEPEF
jgi:enoyl-CoA hydratase/carnithine racemase